MKTTVEWPEGLTRERLMELADWITDAPSGATIAQALRALAAIAPSGNPETEPRYVWMNESGQGISVAWEKRNAPEGALLVNVPVLPKKPRTVTMHFYRHPIDREIIGQTEKMTGTSASLWDFLFTREIELEA